MLIVTKETLNYFIEDNMAILELRDTYLRIPYMNHSIFSSTYDGFV